MPIRNATAHWEGDIKSGSGRVKLSSGAFEGPYSFSSRFENGAGTNPEELLGGSHAACFTMAFDLMLSTAGHPPTSLDTTAKVHIDPVPGGGGFSITKIELSTTGVVPGIDEATFRKLAEDAKTGCPISKALASVPMTLEATLKS